MTSLLPKNHSKENFTLSLNVAQKNAVERTDEHMLVLAGAGSGKTRVIIGKIAHLIQQKKAEPHQILAITFTNKAASEMKSRLLGMGGILEESHLNIRTFHSFGAFFLRKFINNLKPLTNSFSIIDAAGQRALAKEVLLKNDEKELDFKKFLNVASLLKRKMIYPEYLAEDLDLELTVKGILGKNYQSKLRVFRSYDRVLRESNCLDFDDLLGYMVLLLQKSADLREYLGQRWKYLLVDEYQDSDELQEKLIQVFISAKVFTTVVGDDSQSIYGFRGACVDNILSFCQRLPEASLVALEENYRSSQEILSLANAIIEKNPIIYPKKLFTKKPSGEKPLFRHFPSDVEESKWICRNIANLNAWGQSFEKVAILFRANYQTRLVEELLLKSKIPYRVVRGLRFYERKEIKMVVACLNFIVNDKDYLSLFSIINTPPRGIGHKSLDVIKNFMEQHANAYGNTVEALSSNELATKLSKRANQSLQHFAKAVQDLQNCVQTNENLSIIVRETLEKFGILDYFRALKDPMEREDRLNSLDQLVQATGGYFRQSETHPLIDFLEYISLSSAEEDKGKENAVSLITIHNAKGLEYENIHIVGMEENVFPHYLSFSDKEIFEERRLFYVAVTRAKKNLFLSAAHRKFRFGAIESFDVSRFIDETPKGLFHSDSHFFCY